MADVVLSPDGRLAWMSLDDVVKLRIIADVSLFAVCQLLPLMWCVTKLTIDDDAESYVSFIASLERSHRITAVSRRV